AILEVSMHCCAIVVVCALDWRIERTTRLRAALVLKLKSDLRHEVRRYRVVPLIDQPIPIRHELMSLRIEPRKIQNGLPARRIAVRSRDRDVVAEVRLIAVDVVRLQGPARLP